MDHHQIQRLRKLSTPILLCLILLGLSLLVWVFGDKSLGRMATETLIRVTLVVGMWTFIGNSGVISFGHIGYMCVGAYMSAWLTLKPMMKGLLLPGLPDWLLQAQWHPLAAALAAGLAASFIALISGAAILRLSGIAASIATFAFLAIINTIYSNWESVTGATSSVVGLPRYVDIWVALGWASLAIVAAGLYANSASGLALQATREDDIAAQACAVNSYKHRLLSLVVSAFFTGVSGALLGHFIGVINPDSFYLGLTFISLAMLVVGGIGSLTGAVAGVLSIAIIMEGLVRLEQGISVGDLSLALPNGAQEIIIGIAMIIILIKRPKGLANGKDLAISAKFLSRPNSKSPTNQETQTAS